MKKTLLTLITFFITITSFAQAPDLINYQAIIRNDQGNIIQDGNIGMRVSILQTNAAGTSVYTETHTTSTNTNGLVTIMIGSGTTSDDFSAIDWSTGPYFIKTETDVAGGTNYTIVGTSQLLSVPYALYAKNGSKFTETTEGLEYDGGDITLTQPGATIKLTSPDGTVYELGVNDNGQLSVPTSNTSATTPTNFYLYGSFNNWDAANALQFGNGFLPYTDGYVGIKYFTAGTEFKILGAQNESIVYGAAGFTNGVLVPNGGAFVIPGNGLYRILLNADGNGGIQYTVESINLKFGSTDMSYDSTTDSFFANLTPFGNSGSILQSPFYIGGNAFGDNLTDGSIDYGGQLIDRTGTDTFVQLFLNFNSSGTYQKY